tara:strand:+ start:31233 stop:31940 length:708 start_codon:yes stop_codon:yes gene_type:complete
MFAGHDEETHHGLTDYELERVAHIRRNREIMKQLGLGLTDIVTAARGRCGETSSPKKKGKKRKADDDGCDEDENDTSTKRTNENESIEAGIERVLRRSGRLQKKNAELDGAEVDAIGFESSINQSKYLSEYEIDEKHRADAEQYAKRNAGQQEKVSVVGTASYQHTLMRVRTMSEPALKNRVKAIERAKGKHAVVKMRLFARVLFLEGVEEVMEDAAAALERLVKELGDPEEEEE